MKKSIRKKSGRIFTVVNTVLLFAVSFITVAPFIYVLSVSLSGINPILKNQVGFWPVEWTLDGYRAIMTNSDFFHAYGNSLFYTAAGTLISVVLTASAAYALSRKSYSLGAPVMAFVTVTMFFSGGLVPSYILINNLGMYDTRWVMLLPEAVNVFNLIVTVYFMRVNIPDSLVESAKLDGASDLRIFICIALPMAKVIMAVIALYYAAAKWNSYYQAMIYLRDPDLIPLSLYLRRLLIQGGTGAWTVRLRHCAVIVTMAPIACIFPFISKHFTKGVMLGSLKE